jgi:hypothetical protein
MGGIGLPHEALKVLEECFAPNVYSEQLFLQRPARPIREHAVAGIQNSFVEKRDNGEAGIPDCLIRIPTRTTVFICEFERADELLPEILRVGDGLAIPFQSHDRGESFLISQRKIAAGREV